MQLSDRLHIYFIFLHTFIFVAHTHHNPTHSKKWTSARWQNIENQFRLVLIKVQNPYSASTPVNPFCSIVKVRHIVMGRSRSKSRTPKKHHKSKHRKKSKSKDRSDRRSASHTKHRERDKSRDRSSKSRLACVAQIYCSLLIFLVIFCRKRSISLSSNSSSDVSVHVPKHKKKARSRKMDEVERLAEMERQRRQKEAEQKVYYVCGVLITPPLPKRY